MGLIRKFTAANPHLKIALIVTPLLAIGGYIVADLYHHPEASAPPPQTASELQVSGDCRLLGEVCELLHREIAANIGAEPQENGHTLIYLATSVPLQGALLAAEPHDPVAMASRGDTRRWKALLPYPLRQGDRLRLAMVSGERRYFAEITVQR